MKNRSESGVNRRGLLKGSAAMLGGALLPEESYQTTLANVRTDSRPTVLAANAVAVAAENALVLGFGKID